MGNKEKRNLEIAKQNSMKHVVAKKNKMKSAQASSVGSLQAGSLSSTKYLIDEIIHVDIVSSSVAQIPFQHRTFAMFADIADTSITLDRTNYADYVVGLTDATLANYINLWFSANGQALTIYQTPVEPTPPDDGGEDDGEVEDGTDNPQLMAVSIPEIAEGNVILGNLDFATQQSLYSAFSATDKANLSFFFNVKVDDDISTMTLARNIYFMLVDTNADSNNYIFEYLAPYTQARYYRRNNFETSNLAGLKVTSLDLLTANNFGSLVYFPEFSESKYYNMVDSSGYMLNWDF